MDGAGRWLQSDEVDGSLCATTTGQGKDLKIMLTWFLTFVIMILCLRKGQCDVSCFGLADGHVIWRRCQ